MDLEELKQLRKENFLEHKKKKRNYYLKKKLESSIAKKNDLGVRAPIDYAFELKDEGFAEKLREIAKKQKSHVDDRKEIIIAKLQEYKSQKQQYYQENKEKRLEYDKEYREVKKEELKAYRKEYYERNKEKILTKQRQNRLKKKINQNEA